jgi:hypothetical protein
MKPFWSGLLVGVLAMVLAGAIMMRGASGPLAASESPTPGAAKVTGAKEGSSGKRVGDRTASNTTRSVKRASMPLPPPEVPLAPFFPELVRAARSGQPAAMCRLAFEMNRCGPKLRYMREQEESNTDILLYGEPDERRKQQLLQSLRRDAEAREPLEAICAGITLPADLKPWRLVRDAARAGHVPSMLQFAEQPPIDFHDFLDELDGLAAIRDERSAFLERAARAGNAKAAHTLFWDNTGNGSMFGRKDRDPVRALAYGLAIDGIGNEKMRRRVGEETAMLRRKLSQADQRKAERLAATLAPGFASARGADVDLRMHLVTDGSDCAVTDPHTLTIAVRKDAGEGKR